MSSNTTQSKIGSGTNSPPLEATGADKPMGASSVDGSVNAGHKSDQEQRGEYFHDAKSQTSSGDKESHAQKMGQSMAAKMEEAH
ncbi:hypothetical protein D9613_010147 [Agrocybe pediades]|uniref:Uncharacterized protein n=1 Tax=Agrocybe pediades TaxID=84607 RepID=A0A8H4VQU5_9AGAR|nr:hypothetical protein D9613_010147 [Agrocybe pediades]KAF9555252.1 hypothetical protein CPC08DRAFT_137644 [Agrocybe pediades]